MFGNADSIIFTGELFTGLLFVLIICTIVYIITLITYTIIKLDLLIKTETNKETNKEADKNLKASCTGYKMVDNNVEIYGDNFSNRCKVYSLGESYVKDLTITDKLISFPLKNENGKSGKSENGNIYLILHDGADIIVTIII